MPEPTIVHCPACEKANRVRPDASGVPVCGNCGKPLPWLVEADEQSFHAVVEESPVPVLVDFWAPWCGPCRMVSPAVEQMGVELAGRLKVAKVNTDTSPALGNRFSIFSIPTLMLVADGQERDRVVGAQPAPAIKRWLEPRLASLTTRA
jgi:thioredoxin 2